MKHNAIMILLLSNFKKLLERHFYLLLLIPLLFIIYPLTGPGISIAGDFPYLDTANYAFNRLWLWIERGSTDSFEFVPRLPIIGSWYLLSFIGVNSELATKSMVILGFLLSSFSFYFSFLLFFKEKFPNSKWALKISGLMGSLFYAYNVWSFNRVHHWYLWIGYSIFPLFFISIYFSFKNPKDWRYIIFSIFLWSLAATTPHMTLFYGIILIATFLGFICNNLKNKKYQTIRLAIPFLVIITFFFLVNMYWIYPYYLASGTQVLAPNYELTEEILEILSREGSFLNTFRILAYWLSSDVILSEHSMLYYLWVFGSFVIPITAFSALFIKKSIKYALIFSSIALIGIFLAMGSKSPFDYYTLVLTNPTLSNFAWLLRDADKWSFLIVFAYSFLIGLMCYKVFSITQKVKNNDKRKLLISCSFISVLLGSIILTSYPAYDVRMNPLRPVTLPDELDELNKYLPNIKDDKIFFMPYPAYETQWHQSARVGSVYNAHSLKPSIESSEYNLVARNYYNYLANSIKENTTKNIGNLIYPLGTSYLVFHNDTWSKSQMTYDKNNIDILNKLYLREDLKNVENIGFYKIFKTSNNESRNAIEQVNIPSHNIGALSGLDILSSLSMFPSFNTRQSSVLFLDDIRTNSSNTFIKNLDELILNRLSSFDELALSFVDDKYIIAPFDATDHNDPSVVWSKSRARDPTHAEFHPHLLNLGINNWDLDYEKGIVMTKAMGAKLSIPVNIINQSTSDNKDEPYELFMRYLKNQKGGQLKIYVDGKLLNAVDTLDKISNNFMWKEIQNMNLTKGKHTLTLENVAGFNAVNIFTLIPHDEMNKLRTVAAKLLADKTHVIYLLEAESNFYNNSSNIHSTVSLLSEDRKVDGGNDSQTGKIFTGQFKVPKDTDYVVLQILSGKNPNEESSYQIKDLRLSPAFHRYDVFTSDFERKVDSVPLATIRQFDWINYDKDLASTSIETSSPISGESSLRVDLKEGNKAGWNILSTDFVPISNDSYYNASLNISAKDVKQIHSRILYFDSDRQEMSGSTDFIFKGKDGTFQNTFISSILPPREAKYLKYQILTKSANSKASSYVLDDVKLEEIIIPTTFKTNVTGHSDEQIYKDQNLTSVKKDNSLGKEHRKVNSTHYLIETEAIPVKENHVYNYTGIVNAETVPSISVIPIFNSSRDIVEKSTKYGYNASNGRVLTLSPGTEIETGVEILKSSNYSIGLRAKTCDTCTFLRVELDREDYNENDNITRDTASSNISLKDTKPGLKWLTSNSTYLNQGTYNLKIYSDSQTDLDSVLVYENNNIHSNATEESNQTLSDIFSINSEPAKISGFKKLNPTKYVLDIRNATRPFTISLAEAYDPLWIAYPEKGFENRTFKTNSIPLYGVVNGFNVNKTGDYTLIIEYEPQQWFVQGAKISISSLILLLVITIFLVKKKYFIAAYRKIRKNSQTE